MPTLGLVLTLESDSGAPRQAVLDRLERNSELWLGEPVGARLPVVLELEAEARSAVESSVDAIAAAAGVVFVDVVYTHFGDLHPAQGERIPLVPRKTAQRSSEGEESSWS